MNIFSQSTIQGKSLSKQEEHTFLIAVLCVILGAIIRIIYCIQYPVQPRDAFTYGQIMFQWTTSGEISTETIYIPFSLWILRIPHVLLQCDVIKSGIIVNLILGLLIVILVINTTSQYFKNELTILLAGLIAITHPMLVHFSCSCLRENTFLLFALLTLSSLGKYFKGLHISQLFFAGIFGGNAFLCRLEGLEILLIVLISIIFLFVYKKIRLSKAFVHYLFFLAVFAFTALLISFLLDFKINSLERIIMKFDL